MTNQWLKQYCQSCISLKSTKTVLTKAFSIIMLSACIVGGLNSSAHAGTTTADFLKWERKSQESFLQISISMAGVIASQIKPKASKCLDEWYFTSEELQSKRHDEILEIMPQYKDFDPHAFLLAYLEQACGKLTSS